MTRDTVFKLTPAFSATSRMVGLVADSDASFVLLLQMRLTTMSDNDVKPAGADHRGSRPGLSSRWRWRGASLGSRTAHRGGVRTPGRFRGARERRGRARGVPPGSRM